MGLLSLLVHNPLSFLVLVVPLLYSIIIHEISHGWVAYLFGDDTAKSAGRLSLNPLRHLDPVGTLALFIVGFGWAKPVPINYGKMRNFRAGIFFTALAGCAANILIATLALCALQSKAVNGVPILAVTLFVVARINIVLGAFNLIPIPPLDGSRLLLAVLPPRYQIALARFEPYGLLLLFILLFTGVLNPLIVLIQNNILSVIGIFVRLFA